VFEVDTARGSLVLSGSVNATFQSLGSTKNVEVSVARWHRTSPFQWEEREPEDFSPGEQDFAPASAWTAEATLLGNDQLEALVRGQGTAHAKVTWVLFTVTSEIARGIASLDANGLLKVELPSPLRPAHDALILHVHGPGGVVATTWVNDQRALRAARDGVRLNTRLSSGESASEFRLTSDLILRALNGQPISGRARGSHTRSSPNSGEIEGMDEAFNYEDWIRSAYLRIPATGGLSRRSGGFLTRILELLFPQPETPLPGNGDNDDRIQLNDADPNETNSEQPAAIPTTPNSNNVGTNRGQSDREQLIRTCQLVRDAFETRQSDIASAETLALAVFALDMERAQAAFLAPPNMDRGVFDVHRVLVLWFECLGHYGFTPEERSDLLPVASRSAAPHSAQRAASFSTAQQSQSPGRSRLGRRRGAGACDTWHA
jgi:hypothetical protein